MGTGKRFDGREVAREREERRRQNKKVQNGNKRRGCEREILGRKRK